ncbi:MAG: signal peptidase II [Clostridia bacterium]|nr:signal peptidase II [Clostridia bacterium]
MQEMRGNSWLKVVWLGIISLVCVALDQITKILCVKNIALGDSITVIPGVLDFTYIQNRGAAFGSLTGARWVFMIASVIMIVVIVCYVISNRNTMKYTAVITLALIVGGGIGNMIDRIAWGYVIDFVDVRFLPFWKWIFNVADSFVCVGAFLLVIIFIAEEYKNKRKNNDVTTDL